MEVKTQGNNKLDVRKLNALITSIKMSHETKFPFKKSNEQKLSLVSPTQIGILINLQVKLET